MAGKSNDRRVRYTKKVIQESFIHLLEVKDISQISVKEICEEADLNRATFYAHYTDVYDLMKQIQEDLLENVNVYLSSAMKEGVQAISLEIVEKIFEYIKENAQICRLLLSERGDLAFQKRVLTLAYEKNLGLMTKNGAISKEDAEFLYAFTLTGCVGAIQKWLNDDMQKSPQFMARIITQIATGLPGLFPVV
jgi:AcrR family transcriptional regulator